MAGPLLQFTSGRLAASAVVAALLGVAGDCVLCCAIALT